MGERREKKRKRKGNRESEKRELVSERERKRESWSDWVLRNLLSEHLPIREKRLVGLTRE